MPFTPEQLANRLAWEKALLTSNKAHNVLALRLDTQGEYAYCCLGVACSLLGVSPQAMEDVAFPSSVGIFMADFFGPDITGMEIYKLSHMNDGTNDFESHSHPEISAYLTKLRESYLASEAK